MSRTGIYYDFFFDWQTEKKTVLDQNKACFFNFNCSTFEKFVEKKSLKQIGENI